MRLSALDIKKQEFTRVLRGYDPDEVHAYLAELARQWEEMQADVRRSEDRINEMAGKMEHYQRVEEALQEALQTAREGSKQALDNAKQEAALIVKKAMGEADDLTRAAERRRDALEQEVETLRRHRDEIVARLRAFLNAESEILTRFTDREGLRSDFARDSADAPPLDSAAAAGTAVSSGPDFVARDPDVVPRRLPEVVAHDVEDDAPDEDVEEAFDAEELDAVLHAFDEPPAAPVASPAEADGASEGDPSPEIAVPGDEPGYASEADGTSEEELPASFEMTLEEEDAFAVAEEGLAVEAAAEAGAPEPEEEPEALEETLPGEPEMAAGDIPEAEDDEPNLRDEEAAEPDTEVRPAFEEDDEPEYASETDSLTFRFFEPNEEAHTQEETGPSYRPDQEPRPKRSPSYDLEDDVASGDTDTWIVPPAEESEEPASEREAHEPEDKKGLAASSEELEKIRRILSDLD